MHSPLWLALLAFGRGQFRANENLSKSLPAWQAQLASHAAPVPQCETISASSQRASSWRRSRLAFRFCCSCWRCHTSMLFSMHDPP